MSKLKRTYTIEEIRYYLEGCRFVDGYGFRSKYFDCRALNHAIHELEDYEDGIEAMILRRPTTRKENDKNEINETTTTRRNDKSATHCRHR